MTEYAVKAENLAKKYKLYDSRGARLKEFFSFGALVRHREFWAVRDIDIEVPRGSSTALVGRNGSGKSTLLKLISGITVPSRGSVSTSGRISSLLEVGVGFNEELTGWENIYLQGALQGYSRKEMDARAPLIRDFADIGEFMEQPVRLYSSGMAVRLGFACAINVDPDILIIDEALAVGDDRFQRKCYAKLESLHSAGTTLLFVSHSEATVKQLCDHAILLERGEIIHRGAAKYVMDEYHKLLYGSSGGMIVAKDETQSDEEKTSWPDNALSPEHQELKTRIIEKIGPCFNNPLHPDLRMGTRAAEIIDFGIRDEEGNRVNRLDSKGKYEFFQRILFYERREKVHTGFQVKNLRGLPVYWATNAVQPLQVDPPEAGTLLDVSMRITAWLGTGSYYLGFGADSGPGPEDEIYDRLPDAFEFTIKPAEGVGRDSVANLDGQLEINALDMSV